MTAGFIEKAYCTAFNLADVKTEDKDKVLATCTTVSSMPNVFFEVKYPGERCDEQQYTSKCGFGRRKCYNQRCLGFYEGEKCKDSRDCNPVLYCNQGVCSLFKKEGDSCLKHEECGRDMLCYKGGPGSFVPENAGVCRFFFSLEDGMSRLGSLQRST